MAHSKATMSMLAQQTHMPSTWSVNEEEKQIRSYTKLYNTNYAKQKVNKKRSIDNLSKSYVDLYITQSKCIKFLGFHIIFSVYIYIIIIIIQRHQLRHHHCFEVMVVRHVENCYVFWIFQLASTGISTHSNNIECERKIERERKWQRITAHNRTEWLTRHAKQSSTFRSQSIP